MTRRGTLAYYLAAWVIGCFVVALLASMFASQNAPAEGPARLLVLYFLSLTYGAVDILLFAFLLRRCMRLWGTHNLWLWIAAGALLGAVFIRLLLWAGDTLTGISSLSGRGAINWLLLAFWAAPNALRLSGVWQAPAAGAATGTVLCLVDRAFNRPAGQGEAGQAPPA
jgi:hypothetical protein